MSALNAGIRPSAPIQTTAQHRITVDLFLGPVVIALVLFLSVFVPAPAYAQVTAGAAMDFAYQRSMSRIVAGSAAGLQMSSPTTMNIINAGKIVGSFAVTEKRLIDLATLAKYARASTVPGIIALAGTELLAYGLQKCADGSWCKPPAAPSTGVNAYFFQNKDFTGPYYDDPTSACQAGATAKGLPGVLQITGHVLQGDGTYGYYDCVAKDGSGTWQVVGSIFHGNPSKCITGYTYDGKQCVGGTPVPAADADVETAWKGAFQAKPFLQEKVWGFEDQTTQNQQWADALAQLASVAAPSTVTVADPTTSTTTPTGTTKVDRSCTYAAAANADAGSQKDRPASVGVTCTTTTTAPDGTVTQQTTKTDASPQGGQTVPQKVDIDTCGLPGKPACKIDETGTTTEADGKAKVTAAANDLATARQDAVQKMNDAAKQTDFGLKMPTLLPGGSCQPIQFFKWKDFNGTVDLCEKLGFIRTLLSWLWGAGAAIYIYNRVSSANA